MTKSARGDAAMARRLVYGQRLKAARMALGYDVANDFCREVNRRAGLKPSAHEGLLTAACLNNYETGDASFRFGSQLVPILVSMGISMDYLATGQVAHLPPSIRVATLVRLRSEQRKAA